MISIILPIYNEIENISTLYRRISDSAATWEMDYEVIAVNDGSADGSLQALKELNERDERWKILSFSRNFGHQYAISAGIHFSSGDAVVIMDADLQDPPEKLKPFIDKWQEGYQVVYAIRTKRKENIFKRVAYSLFYRILQKLASIEMPLDSGDFCLMDRSVVNVLNSLPEKNRFVRGLRSWSGFKQIGIVYERDARHAGDVKYTFTKLLKLAIDGIISFSSVPLRIASWIGIAQCFISLLVIVGVIIWKFLSIPIFGMYPNQAVGWTSLVSLVLFLSGIQMLLIGIMGEYMARIFEEVKSRHPWIISHAYGFKDDLSEKDKEKGWFILNQENK